MKAQKKSENIENKVIEKTAEINGIDQAELLELFNNPDKDYTVVNL
jgi:hypothetical protein